MRRDITVGIEEPLLLDGGLSTLERLGVVTKLVKSLLGLNEAVAEAVERLEEAGYRVVKPTEEDVRIARRTTGAGPLAPVLAFERDGKRFLVAIKHDNTIREKAGIGLVIVRVKG